MVVQASRLMLRCELDVTVAFCHGSALVDRLDQVRTGTINRDGKLSCPSSRPIGTFGDRIQRPTPSVPVSGPLLITARACDVIVGRPEHAKTIKQVGDSSGRICESGGVNQVTWFKQLADHQGRAAAADESYVVHGKSPLSVRTPYIGWFTASSAAPVSPIEIRCHFAGQFARCLGRVRRGPVDPRLQVALAEQRNT